MSDSGRASAGHGLNADAAERLAGLTVGLQASSRSDDIMDFFENGGVGISVVGPDGTICKANRAELDMLGYTREDYVGRRISEFHVDADVAGDVLAKLGSGVKLDKYPARLFAKDGTIREVRITSGAKVDDGRLSGTRCFTVDVTRFESGDDAALPLDECPMAVALKENREVRGLEVLGERPDGTRVPIVPFPTPLRDENGKVTGAINVLIDLSERKQAEANQRVLLKELNHRVKNNFQMLYSLLRSAERETGSAEARAELAAATHRVGAIAAARVLYDAGSDLAFEANEFLESVFSSARQTLVGAVDIEIVETASAHLPNDSTMPLALIMNELFTNAAKYGRTGDDRVRVRVGLKQQDDTLVLTFEDDGPGFQLQNVRKRASGLGLVGGLARQLGGSFEVEAAKGDVASDDGVAGARCVLRFAHRGMAAENARGQM